MPNQLDHNQMSFCDKLSSSAMIAAPRVIITFGLGHPFDLVKTQMQASPYITSGVLLSKEIYKKTGIKGFYTGGLANFARSVSKEAYRSPLRGMLAAGYRELMPRSNLATRSTLTGLSMALADTIIICPLERLKVWMMTAESKHKKIFNFFGERARTSESFSSFYFKGINISLARSAISWNSYLVPEALLREYVIKNSSNIDWQDPKNPSIPILEKLIIGISSGIINGLCTYPLDTLKTKVQESQNHATASVSNMLKIGRKQIMQYGFTKALYSGFLTRLVHYAIVGIITSDIIQKVDAIWQPSVQSTKFSNNK